MYEWGIVNVVVSPEELIPTALKWARKICDNSPDAVIVSRTGMLMSLHRISPLCMIFVLVANYRWKP